MTTLETRRPASDDIFPEAFRRLTPNLPLLGWLAAVYLLVILVLLVILGLFYSWLGQAWLALLATLPFLLLVLPAARLVICHLALNLWDDGQASLAEAAGFVRLNLKDAYRSAWCGLHTYEIPLLWRFLVAALPGAVVLAAFYLIPRQSLFVIEFPPSWETPVIGLAVIMTLIVATFKLWSQARSILTFLYRFSAFEIVDGHSPFSADLADGPGNNWSSRFARMFHRLSQEPYNGYLTKPIWTALAVMAVWLWPAALVVSSSWLPMSKIYALAFGPLFLRFILNLWYTAASAGYYRAHWSPPGD
ncbi:MAG: hypothetical protein LBP55_06835 [Candidatus Adiutrix sp.]|nr:hypothetical protein [Candidatus Adiutrix sp.]